MFRSVWIAGILQLTIVALSWAGDSYRASELMALPPVLQSYFGDPLIKVKAHRELGRKSSVSGTGSYHSMRGIQPPRSNALVVLRSPAELSKMEVRDRAAGLLLNRFYDGVLALDARSWHERRMNLAEIVPFDREDFAKWGTLRLAGKRSGRSWFDAWWTIRMGLPQTMRSGHQITLSCLHFDHDDGKETLGHFCFGLRKKGGDAQGDIHFDFRAPWYVDRQPRKTEGLNLHNELILEGFGMNLYDWLYTQTSYRNCHVDLYFLPASREQVILLKHYNSSQGYHDAGYFRAFRKNCASMGLAFLDRLEPLSEKSSLGKGLADIPVKKIQVVLDRYEEEIPHYRLENVTDELGREPTAKSHIYRAQPSRAASRPFQLLRGVPEAN